MTTRSGDAHARLRVLIGGMILGLVAAALVGQRPAEATLGEWHGNHPECENGTMYSGNLVSAFGSSTKTVSAGGVTVEVARHPFSSISPYRKVNSITGPDATVWVLWGYTQILGPIFGEHVEIDETPWIGGTVGEQRILHVDICVHDDPPRTFDACVFEDDEWTLHEETTADELDGLTYFEEGEEGFEINCGEPDTFEACAFDGTDHVITPPMTIEELEAAFDTYHLPGSEDYDACVELVGGPGDNGDDEEELVDTGAGSMLAALMAGAALLTVGSGSLAVARRRRQEIIG